MILQAEMHAMKHWLVAPSGFSGEGFKFNQTPSAGDYNQFPKSVPPRPGDGGGANPGFTSALPCMDATLRLGEDH